MIKGRKEGRLIKVEREVPRPDPCVKHLTTNTIPGARTRIVHGHGVTITDDEGTSYIDLGSATLNMALGHQHGDVTQAVLDQMSRVWFVPTLFNNPAFLELAQLLKNVAPEGISAVNLRSCNGGDAVDCAIKMARIHTRRSKLLCGRSAWHGESMAVLPLSSLNTYHRVVSQRDVVYADEKTLESFAQLIVDNPDAAAALLDPLGVSNGIFEPTTIREGLHLIQKLCTKYGILLIMDELQTFGGYMGDDLFASNHYGITPDIICIGKAFGAGIPISATLCKDYLRSVLMKAEAEYTYGGQPLGCVAAIQAIKSFLGMQQKVRENLEMFEKQAAKLKQDFPSLRVRQVGFFAAVTRRDGRLSENWIHYVQQLGMKRGLLLRNNHYRSILIKPPVIIEPDVTEDAFRTIAEIFTSAEKELQQPSYLFAELINLGVRPTSLTRIRKRPPVPDQWQYVGALLSEIGSTLSVKKVDAAQQAKSVQLLRRAGIPAVEVYVSDDGCPEYLYQAGVSMESYMENNVKSDPAMVNGFVLEHQRYVEMAHDAGLSIPDRWPGNAIVNGASLKLIDFDLTYCDSTGSTELLFCFEELFSTFQCIAWVKCPVLQQDLSNRLCLAVLQRHGSMAERVWRGMVRFYSNPSKPNLPESLSHSEYMKAIETMSVSINALSEM